MEQLTADGDILPDVLANTEEELDRELARAIRQLISRQISLTGTPGAGDLQSVA